MDVDGPIRLDVSAHEPAATELPVASISKNGRGVVAWTRDVEDGAAGPLEVAAGLHGLRLGAGGAAALLGRPR